MRTSLLLVLAVALAGCTAPDDSPPPQPLPVDPDTSDADPVPHEQPDASGSVTGKLVTRLSSVAPLGAGTLVRLDRAAGPARRAERSWDWKEPFRFEDLAAGAYLLESELRGHVVGVRFDIDGGVLDLGKVDVTDGFARPSVVSGMAVRIDNAPSAAREVRLALHHPDWPAPLRRVATVPVGDVAPIDNLAPGTYTIEVIAIDGGPAGDVPPQTATIEEVFSSELQPIAVIDLAGVKR